MLKVNW